MAGERLWERKWHMGAPPKYKDPQKLWEDCCAYFEWLEDNPLYEAKAFSYQGEVTVESLPKMRAATLDGLHLHLGICDQTWRNWRNDREDLIGVITRVEKMIREQKFAGAAAELLNPNIIARDLGLADKQEHTGKDGGPIQTKDMTEDQLARWLAFKLRSGVEEKK